MKVTSTSESVVHVLLTELVLVLVVLFLSSKGFPLNALHWFLYDAR